MLILLVNEISLDQQLYNVLLQRCSHSNQTLIVVHNFKHIYSIDSINDKILELKDGLNLDHIKLKGGYTYYQQETAGSLIKHLIFAREDSQAGIYFNPGSISIINQLIASQSIYDDFNPLNSFLKFTQLNLKNYIDMIETNDNLYKLPIEYKDGLIQSKCKFGLSSFFRESFAGVIDKLEQNNSILDHIILKDEKFLLAFFFIPYLKEDSLKVIPAQPSPTNYSLKLEGKRMMINTNETVVAEGLSDNQKGENENRLSNNNDFQVMVAFEVNHKYDTNKNNIQTSYKKSILMIRIPKLEEKKIISSLRNHNYQ